MEQTLISKLETFAKEHDMELHDLLHNLNQYEKFQQETKISETVDANKELIGKCFYKITKPHNGMFPEMKRFFKVISNRSNNQYRVECLIFDEHPTYWFDYQAHKANFAGDYYLGHFEFQSFHTDSIMVTTLQSMTEISPEEFEIYAHNYYKELLNTKWSPDHYRYGGKLPTDPDWPEKEKPIL